MGLVYGPLGMWLPGLFPVRVRYTGASVASNVGGILGGAGAPIAAQWLSDRGGTRLAGLYPGVAGLLSLLGLLLVRSRVDSIGTALCRERVCEYVSIPVAAGSLKQQYKRRAENHVEPTNKNALK